MELLGFGFENMGFSVGDLENVGLGHRQRCRRSGFTDVANVCYRDPFLS